MPKKKRKIKKSFISIAVLTLLVIVVFLLLITNPSFWFKKSIHEDAKKYMNKHCLVFYPDSSIGKAKAKQLCKQSKENKIFDYSLVPYGDYYLVRYGNEMAYFTDKNFMPLEIGEINNETKNIISDYLRYSIKKEKPDLYYTVSFLENSNADKLNLDNITYEIDGEFINFYFSDYDIETQIPLKYMQESLGIDLGYKDIAYVKPTYIDTSSKHPIICLTFDDGPQLWRERNESNTVKIVEELKKYDACATFFIVGDNLVDNNTWTDFETYSFLKETIENGNELGSHTMSHEYLTDLTAEEITKTIKSPSDIVYDLIGYQMSLYRPVSGVFNDDINNASPFPAILWSDDSYDWETNSSEEMVDYINNRKYYPGDIIIFHDIYDDTAKAIESILPSLIEKGYQLLTVSDMFVGEDIDKTNLKFYYNLYPSPYYE